MAHDYSAGTIYIDTNTTPHTGVSVEEVATILGAQAGEELCSHPNINALAKYKPVKLATLGMTGRTYGGNYWHGEHGQCGLSIPSDFLNYISTFARGTVAWSHDAPDSNYPHRLLDFDGYNGSGTYALNNKTTIITGYLTEEGQQVIDFQGGFPIFHVHINPQPAANSDFLRLDQITLYRNEQTQMAMSNSVPMLHLISADGQNYMTLSSDAVKVDQHDSDRLANMTMAEIIAAGKTTLTFSHRVTFNVSNIQEEPAVGAVYTYNTTDFIISEVIKEGSPLAVTQLECICSGTYPNIPASGYISKKSGTGQWSIYYDSVDIPYYRFASKTYYVFPFFYDEYGQTSLVCGFGRPTPQIQLKSVTNSIGTTVTGADTTNRVPAKNGDTSFIITYNIDNGYAVDKQVIVHFYLSRATDYNTLFERTYEKTSAHTVTAGVEQSFSVTKSDSNLSGYPWTGVRIEFEYEGVSHWYGDYYYENNIYDPEHSSHQ